jgi:hypothetical protein
VVKFVPPGNMNRASLNLDTALGPFLFEAVCDQRPGDVSLDLKTFEPRLSLPPRMSVQRCRAVVLQVTTRVDVRHLRWACESPPGVAGSPCCGEDLNAQEWEALGHLVVVGTEDEEALARRLGFLRDLSLPSLAHFSPQKLETRLPHVPASAAFGLHFVLAENPSPEPAEMSAWFAVDIPHDRLAAPDAA